MQQTPDASFDLPRIIKNITIIAKKEAKRRTFVEKCPLFDGEKNFFHLFVVNT